MLKLQQMVDASAAVKANLEADNLALYSKIRFLQNYSHSDSSRRPMAPSQSKVDNIFVFFHSVVVMTFIPLSKENKDLVDRRGTSR